MCNFLYNRIFKENKETAKKSGKLKSRAIESVQLDEPTKDVNQQ